MKTLSARAKTSGFTLVELLVAIGLIIVLVMVLLPTSPQKIHAPLVECMSNQKQVALAFLIWKDDHDGKFPWEVSRAKSGTMESSEKGDAAANYSALLAYVHLPRAFVCPTDAARTVATNQAMILDQNASYFIGLDITTNPAAGILTGDRNLKTGQMPVGSGLFVYSNGLPMDWTRELHGDNRSSPMGVMSFEDGHAAVEHGTNTDLTFQNESLATSRFAVP